MNNNNPAQENNLRGTHDAEESKPVEMVATLDLHIYGNNNEIIVAAKYDHKQEYHTLQYGYPRLSTHLLEVSVNINDSLSVGILTNKLAVEIRHAAQFARVKDTLSIDGSKHEDLKAAMAYACAVTGVQTMTDDHLRWMDMYLRSLGK